MPTNMFALPFGLCSRSVLCFAAAAFTFGPELRSDLPACSTGSGLSPSPPRFGFPTGCTVSIFVFAYKLTYIFYPLSQLLSSLAGFSLLFRQLSFSRLSYRFISFFYISFFCQIVPLFFFFFQTFQTISFPAKTRPKKFRYFDTCLTYVCQSFCQISHFMVYLS